MSKQKKLFNNFIGCSLSLIVLCTLGNKVKYNSFTCLSRLSVKILGRINQISANEPYSKQFSFELLLIPKNVIS